VTLSTEPRTTALEDDFIRGNEPPAVRALDEIIAQAVDARASDVHLEPSAMGGRVRQRVDGNLHAVRELSPDLFTQVVARVKVLAAMDVADRRQPQDGGYVIAGERGSIDARVASLPSVDGEKIVIRLLSMHAAIPTLDQLGMTDELLVRFRRILRGASGSIFMCGPTGSGKTTTAYASIAERNVIGQHVCAVEDPVEMRVPGVTQVQVNVKAGVTFASALRSFLRADPNVIMVGEVRDAETAGAAIAAALSGQLIVSTFHAGNALQAFERLSELGVRRGALAAGVSAILSQRLVRRLCVCSEARRIEPEAAARYELSRNSIVRESRGCEACGGCGFRGRAAIFELVVPSAELRHAIASDAPATVAGALARRDAGDPLERFAGNLLLRGETSQSELDRHVRGEET